jgi:hypothetical protein
MEREMKIKTSTTFYGNKVYHVLDCMKNILATFETKEKAKNYMEYNQ